MANTRARKGGETGLNGEHYDGGQFLPSSSETEKGATKTATKKFTGKQEIAPYKWAVDSEGRRSIWSMIIGVCEFTKTGYSKETGATGTLTACNYYNWDSEVAYENTKSLAEKWNNGERWTN